MPDAPTLDRTLAILLRVGTGIAEELETPTPDISVVDRARAFEGVARALRQTVLLADHLATRHTERTDHATRRTQRRTEIIRAVEDTIDREARPPAVEPLRRELLERLDSPDFELDLAARTPAQIVVDLCRDLGLVRTPGIATPRRRTPDDIAILCAQAAAAPGSGLAAWLAAAAPQAARNDEAARASAPDRDDRTLCDHLLNRPGAKPSPAPD